MLRSPNAVRLHASKQLRLVKLPMSSGQRQSMKLLRLSARLDARAALRESHGLSITFFTSFTHCWDCAFCSHCWLHAVAPDSCASSWLSPTLSIRHLRVSSPVPVPTAVTL